MVFSCPVFLFLFLPLTLGIYFLIPRRAWNAWLLFASLFFYAWGEKLFVFVMLASIALNYFFGLMVERFRGKHSARFVVGAAIATNLGLLITYKYANFLADVANAVLTRFSIPPIALGPVHLPIGISFFTFHALSYVIDVHRSHARAQRNPINLALYITLFPQLIAGPILRFHEIAHQLEGRAVRWADFAYGVRRFVIGLAKKVLLANPLAVPADQIFGITDSRLSPAVAWLGVICYTLQIYFDFSGYSDMAVGLGKMFGFQFPENFHYPYTSRSVKEFWRRWHISLSTWFRDYLYIPLGGNRVSAARNYFNLILVFFLCGLWHGASWTFVFWGLYHGFFLILERPPVTRWLESAWRPVGHLYALLVVVVGWVFFRATTIDQACGFLKLMSGLAPVGEHLPVSRYLDFEVKLALLFAVFAATPILPMLGRVTTSVWQRSSRAARVACAFLEISEVTALLGLLLLSLMRIAAGTYSPFIYFRF